MLDWPIVSTCLSHFSLLATLYMIVGSILHIYLVCDSLASALTRLPIMFI